MSYLAQHAAAERAAPTLADGTGFQPLYAFHDIAESGRFSQSDTAFGKAVWDLSTEIAFVGYGAVASQKVDFPNDYYHIVRLQDESPFPIDAGGSVSALMEIMAETLARQES